MKLQLFTLTILFLSCSAPNQETRIDSDTLGTFNSLSFADTSAEIPQPSKIDLSNETYPVELTDNNLEITIDTIVDKEFLKDSYLLSYKFKLPRLNRKTMDSTLTFYNDSIELSINTNIFQKENHDITYDKVFIEKIDGRYPWGIDGNQPSTEIKSIQLKRKSNEISIPDSIYNDLFEPNIKCYEIEGNNYCYIEGYVSKKGEILLQMENGDGAGYYTAFIFFNPDNSIERIIGH